MSSSETDRRAILLALAALAGCGFEPVYAPGGQGAGLRGRIDIATPADEEGYALVRRLEDRLGQGPAPDLRMDADIRITEDPVGYLPDGTISRYNVLGQVDWRLTRIADGAAVIHGSEKSFASYSATSTTVATIYAQRDARRRLMVILADRIAADIMARAGSL